MYLIKGGFLTNVWISSDDATMTRPYSLKTKAVAKTRLYQISISAVNFNRESPVPLHLQRRG